MRHKILHFFQEEHDRSSRCKHLGFYYVLVYIRLIEGKGSMV